MAAGRALPRILPVEEVHHRADGAGRIQDSFLLAALASERRSTRIVSAPVIPSAEIRGESANASSCLARWGRRDRDVIPAVERRIDAVRDDVLVCVTDLVLGPRDEREGGCGIARRLTQEEDRARRRILNDLELASRLKRSESGAFPGSLRLPEQVVAGPLAGTRSLKNSTRCSTPVCASAGLPLMRNASTALATPCARKLKVSSGVDPLGFQIRSTQLGGRLHLILRRSEGGRLDERRMGSSQSIQRSWGSRPEPGRRRWSHDPHRAEVGSRRERPGRRREATAGHVQKPEGHLRGEEHAIVRAVIEIGAGRVFVAQRSTSPAHRMEWSRRSNGMGTGSSSDER